MAENCEVTTMSESEVRYIFNEMGAHISNIYQHIDNARQELHDFNEATSRAEAYLKDFTRVFDTMQEITAVLKRFEQQRVESQQALQQLQGKCVEAHTQLKESLTPIENASRVMRREVTYSADALEEGHDDIPETIEKSVIALLRLGIRLAKTVYSPERIAKLKQDKDTMRINAFRKAWETWLQEINAYMQEVISVSKQYTEIGDTGEHPNMIEETIRLQRQMQASTADEEKPVHEQEKEFLLNENEIDKKHSTRRSIEKASTQSDDAGTFEKDDVA